MTGNDTWQAARHWEAGETGCGQLVVGLGRRLDRLSTGELLRVTALDAGAPVDLPAWCRMTGHALVFMAPPVYVLRKGGRDPKRNVHARGESR